MYLSHSTFTFPALFVGLLCVSPLTAPQSSHSLVETEAAVFNEAPVVLLSHPTVVACEGAVTAVVLDASASYDPDGDPITFQWQACPGTILSDPTGPITTAYLDTSASCSLVCGFRLRVVDDSGLAGFVRTYVEVVPPECVDATVNCSNFNGTAIPAGRYIWFNSVVKPTGLPATGGEIFVSDAQIDFTANGHAFSLPVPDAKLVYSPSALSATTIFDAIAGRWVTTVPATFSGNVFFTGLPFLVPENLPGGINPVCFSATFSTAEPGVTFKWKWAAAVFTSFSSDRAAVGVKPIDGSASNPYHNSHHAGSPENFLNFAVGGARGGGASNVTGSYSGTVSGGCP